MRNLFFVVAALLLLTACDPNRVVDENKEIATHNWYYKDRIGFDVLVEDTNSLYNIYINTRIRSDFKYSNLFVMLYTQQPDKKESSQRYELTLADERGKWLGKGLGDIYDNQHLIIKNVILPQRGIYRYNLEQNMRDDTLASVVAMGMRIEKAGPRF